MDHCPIVSNKGGCGKWIKKKRALIGPDRFLAERVGFEPTKGYKPLLVFKTSAFNRSATSPDIVDGVSLASANCRRSAFLIQQLEKFFGLRSVGIDDAHPCASPLRGRFAVPNRSRRFGQTHEGLQILAGFQDQRLTRTIHGPCPAGALRASKFAPGEFVNRSATSPEL